MEAAILKYLAKKVKADLEKVTPLHELSEDLRAVLSYLAAKIVVDLKSLTNLSDEVYDAIDEHPLIDFVREKISDDDKQFVVALIRSESIYQRKLGIVLACKLKSDGDIHNKDSMWNILLETWDVRKDFDTRFNLMWHLLDFETLPLKMHQVIFQ